MQVAKTLIAHLDWGLNAADSIAEPNIYFGGQAVIIEAGTPMAARASELAKFGQTVLTTGLSPKANAAELTPQGWKGAADRRSEGNALEE